MADPLSIATWRNVFTKHGSKVGWGLAVIVGLPLIVTFGLSSYNTRGQAAAANDDTTVLSVNGDPVTLKQYRLLSRMIQGRRSEKPGAAFVSSQGKIIQGITDLYVMQQQAQKLGVRPSDTDVDRKIAADHKGVSDTEWESMLDQNLGMTPPEYREWVAKSPDLLQPAFLQYFRNATKITEDDARNQYAEVKLDLVVVPSVSAAGFTPPMAKGPRPLPDTDALKQAMVLRSKVLSGEDIAKVARANSSDPSSKNGGILDWLPENKASGQMGEFGGSLGFGKAFDMAVHNTPKGQLTDVVKVGGFSHGSGYVFARVLDRRVDLPKTFDVKKEMETLRDQRAQEQLAKLKQASVKAAKVDVKDADKKAYYDYAKSVQMEQEAMMATFGGDAASAPSQAQVAQQKALASTELEGVLKRDPLNTSAALVVAEDLSRKINTVTGPEKDAMRKRLITLYETALKSTEDREIRFTLAGLYKDDGQLPLADAQYQKISKLLSDDPPYKDAGSQMYQEARTTRKTLADSFKSIGRMDEAAFEQAQIPALQAGLNLEQAKEAAAGKGGSGFGGSMPVGVSPGGTSRPVPFPFPTHRAIPGANGSRPGAVGAVPGGASRISPAGSDAPAGATGSAGKPGLTASPNENGAVPATTKP